MNCLHNQPLAYKKNISKKFLPYLSTPDYHKLRKGKLQNVKLCKPSQTAINFCIEVFHFRGITYEQLAQAWYWVLVEKESSMTRQCTSINDLNLRESPVGWEFEPAALVRTDGFTAAEKSKPLKLLRAKKNKQSWLVPRRSPEWLQISSEPLTLTTA